MSTAWSVGTWTWSGGGALDHGFVAQSRRGRAAAKVKRYRAVPRDREIVRRLDGGESQRAIGRALDVSRGTVRTARARLRRPRRAPRGEDFSNLVGFVPNQWVVVLEDLSPLCVSLACGKPVENARKRKKSVRSGSAAQSDANGREQG